MLAKASAPKGRYSVRSLIFAACVVCHCLGHRQRDILLGDQALRMC
jgi:hypothetical protein